MITMRIPTMVICSSFFLVSGQSGDLLRAFLPPLWLLSAARWEVRNDFPSRRPIGPGAFEPALPPVEKPLSAPRRAWSESLGRRKPRIARTTQIAITAAINMGSTPTRLGGSQVLLDLVGFVTVRARLGSLALDPLARTL